MPLVRFLKLKLFLKLNLGGREVKILKHAVCVILVIISAISSVQLKGNVTVTLLHSYYARCRASDA